MLGSNVTKLWGVISAKIQVNCFVCLLVTTGAHLTVEGLWQYIHPNVTNINLRLHPNENYVQM